MDRLFECEDMVGLVHSFLPLQDSLRASTLCGSQLTESAKKRRRLAIRKWSIRRTLPYVAPTYLNPLCTTVEEARDLPNTVKQFGYELVWEMLEHLSRALLTAANHTAYDDANRAFYCYRVRPRITVPRFVISRDLESEVRIHERPGSMSAVYRTRMIGSVRKAMSESLTLRALVN